jgi:hypothetical protein
VGGDGACAVGGGGASKRERQISTALPHVACPTRHAPTAKEDEDGCLGEHARGGGMVDAPWGAMVHENNASC